MKIYLITQLFILTTVLAFSQNRHTKGPNQVTYPEVSKHASISQTIGITSIEIDYHRPKTLGRQLWGALIPYDKVWRAGANESTTISFTDDVLIEGHLLAAGKYSLHMIPKEKDWTVIFSTNYTQWGSFFYNEAEDALRVSVKPQSAPHQETLKYEFDNLQDSAATIILHWEKIKIPFEVKVNQNQIVIEEFKRNLQTLPRFRWFGNREAALYCLVHETHLDEGMEWIDRSLRFEEKFQNLIVKADLLRLQNKIEEADEWEKKAKLVADTIDWVAYGYETMMHHGQTEKAIEFFNRGIKYYPESYILHRSLGDAYGRNKNKTLAKASFDQAASLARNDSERKQLANYRARYYLKE